MVTSVRAKAKRAFVAVLLEIARLYGLRPSINRDSSDGELEKAFKKVILRAHPDKGGTTESFQKLEAARSAWQAAAAPSPGGRPKTNSGQGAGSGESAGLTESGLPYRVQSLGAELISRSMT
jgi:hypothetical protein